VLISLTPCVPTSLCPGSRCPRHPVSQCPHVPRSLGPDVPMPCVLIPLTPSVPMSLCLTSRCPHVPVSQILMSLTASVLASLGPIVPDTQCPNVLVSLCP
ncbi:hypothetical protein Y956_14643, partial [Nipponia nippon]